MSSRQLDTPLLANLNPGNNLKPSSKHRRWFRLFEQAQEHSRSRISKAL